MSKLSSKKVLKQPLIIISVNSHHVERGMGYILGIHT
jgi:hypothetical protein